MIQQARRGRYAVGAFNFCNAETAKAIIDEAANQRSPVILIVGPLDIPLLGARMLVDVAKSAAAYTSVPVCLHLDHADDIITVRECIEADFPSVMIDGSKYGFEENISMTREVVKIAHAQGVTVEGELGAIGRVGESTEKGGKAFFTDPDVASEFVERTGVDALAVSIGNVHGSYTRRPQLDFERLEEIRNATGVPLVLHGGSGTPPEQLYRAIDIGICKVNVASDLSKAYLDALRPAVDSKGKKWYSHALIDSRNAVAKVVARWIQQLGSDGAA